MNPERMSKDQNKKEFARFVEDYNTGPSCLPFNFSIGNRAKRDSHFSQRKILQH